MKPEIFWKLARFGAVGIVVMGVFMALNWILGHGLSEQIAFLCAYPPSVALHFFLNKRWTFEDKRTASARQIGEYLVMVLVTFVIQWSVFTALRTWSTWPGWLAAGAANVAQMAVSFVMMQVRVFAAITRVPATQRPRPRAAYAAVVVIVLAWYGYVGVRTNPSLIHGQPVGLYDRLTEGFVAGQTHLKLIPDPRLKTLPNPWAGAQGIPRAHDATYFNDRYYVYFGAAPTVVLLVPWRVLTGTFLPDGAATGIFCTVGFLLALSFYSRCERLFFWALGRGWIFIFGLMIGLGSFVQFELRSKDFYQVPIACAFACGLGVAHALLTAATARSLRRQAVALALASLLGGLAVGARPNYFFALGSVAFVGVWIWLRQARTNRSRSPSAWWLLAATVGPASLIGASIAAYNYARFGSLLEFGLRYQFAAVDMREIKLFGLERVRLAFEGYVLAGRDYGRYFPFIRQTSENIGLLTWAPFALVALAWPLTWLTKAGRSRAWLLGLGGLWLIALLNFGSLMLYYYVFDRYVLDFLPAMTLVASVMVSAWLARTQGAQKRMGGAALVALLGYTSLHSIVHGLPSSDWPEMRWVAGIFNRLPAWYERMTGVGYGAVDVDVEFANGTTGAQEVLVATARGRCVLMVQYLGERRAEIQLFSGETMGPASAPFDFEPGRRYRLRVDLGSLYPPTGHAVYRDRDDAQVKVLRRRVDVRLDGHDLLRFASSFPDSEPEKIELGRNAAVAGAAAFRGKLTLLGRVGLPEPKNVIAPADRAGPVRLRVRFPVFRAQVGQPLIATGHAGAGDLFYVFYAGPNRLRFGHDAWNFPGFETPDFFYDPDVEHSLEVDMGSLHPEAKTADLHASRTHLRVRLDGRELVNVARPFNPSLPQEVFIGHNGIGASTSEVNFSGKRLGYERVPAWPEPATGGARFFTVTLSNQRVIGRSEPLLVTGQTGAADIIYLKYTDTKHVQIGYDQWGRGGNLSLPIALQNGRALGIEVSLGSLYGGEIFPVNSVTAEVLKHLRSSVQVRVDGRVVLRQSSQAFPARPEQIQVGLNTVGASTCVEVFSGKIERIEFLGVPELP
ncbi:MAG: GtrA family protein [Opitutaceae bacterium]